MRNRRLAPSRALLAVVLAFMASLAAPSLSLAADVVGAVAELQGRSTGLLEGLARDLAAGGPVYLEETLRTSPQARLAVKLGERTSLRLGERTQVRIERAIVDRGGELVLQRGALLFDRADSEKSDSLTVRTAFAVIATRGTRFFVGPSDGVVGVFCERGRLIVSNSGGTVSLVAGQGTNLRSASIAPSPPVTWGAARVARALQSVN